MSISQKKGTDGLFVIVQVFSTLLEWVRLGRKTEQEKDLEILLLRVSRAEKLTLAILTTKLKSIANRTTSQLHKVIRICQPATVIRWHHEVVRLKWTYRRKSKGGRPRKPRELEQLVVRLAKENDDWGNARIEGECRKLGYDNSDVTRW